MWQPPDYGGPASSLRTRDLKPAAVAAGWQSHALTMPLPRAPERERFLRFLTDTRKLLRPVHLADVNRPVSVIASGRGAFRRCEL